MSGRDAMGRRIHRLAPAEDVERELRAHLDLRAAELIAAGWEPAAARAEAMRVFGDLDSIRGECRTVAERHARSTDRSRVWSELLQDLRYAWRGLVKQPLFALLAVTTLALGIGANSAAFAIVNGVLLTPLPYEEPARLVALREINESQNEVDFAWPNFRDVQSSARTLSGMAAYRPGFPQTVLGADEPVRAQIALVSGTFFDVLGVPPAAGRAFDPAALAAGGAVHVVVSDAFWRRALNSTSDLTTVRLNIDGMPVQVIGIMPASFDMPHGVELWFPLDTQESSGLGARSAHNYQVVARLAPGATMMQAQQELSALAEQIRARDAESDATAIAVRGLLEDSVGTAGRALLILLGASAFVLLVACTNLASALLARAARRSSELAIRASLGAQRVRLIRQLLTESVLLATCGAIAGLGLAHFLLRAAAILGPDAVPRLQLVTLDGWVLGFTTLLAVATALTFGIAPALRATTAQPYDALRTGGRGTDTRAQRRAWSLLVGTEVALALLLLVGSGLMIRSFYKLTTVEPGFDTRDILAVDVALPRARFAAEDARVRYFNAVIERVRSQPGVRHAAVSMTLPLGGFDPAGLFVVEGKGLSDAQASYRVVSPGFFEVLNIPLRQGRAFTDADRGGAPDVAVIDEEMARRYFGAEDPIGRRFSTGGMDGRSETFVTIVGVVGAIRFRSLDAAPDAAYYLPYMQRPDRLMNATVLVRTSGDATSFANAIRETIRALDADVGVELTTLEHSVSESLAERRFILFVLCLFAGIALILAGIGIYGVVSFAVAQRTREIGIRVTLGAAGPRVLWTVSRHTITAVAAGVIAGLAAALVLSRFVASLLYDVQPFDVPTYASVALVLIGTAALALVIPAVRALRVTPMTALRSE
jgi:putative ABC transport system permease protein